MPLPGERDRVAADAFWGIIKATTKKKKKKESKRMFFISISYQLLMTIRQELFCYPVQRLKSVDKSNIFTVPSLLISPLPPCPKMRSSIDKSKILTFPSPFRSGEPLPPLLLEELLLLGGGFPGGPGGPGGGLPGGPGGPGGGGLGGGGLAGGGVLGFDIV